VTGGPDDTPREGAAAASDREFMRQPNPFNAFMREKSLGCVGRPDPSAIAMECHNRTAIEIERLNCRVIAASDSAAHAADSHKWNGRFGPTSREMRAQSVVQQTSQSRDLILAHTDGKVVSKEQTAKAVVANVMANPYIAKISVMILAAENSMLAISKVRARERVDAINDLVDWSNTVGKQHMDALLNSTPQLRSFKDSFVIVPTLDGVELEYVGQPLKAAAIAAMVPAAEIDGLFNDFRERCAIIQHDECQPCDDSIHHAELGTAKGKGKGNAAGKKTPSCKLIGPHLG